MSHKPIAGMSGISLLGGISAYTRYGSTPSLIASSAIAGAMIMSSMRIRDGMDYGLEAAAASSTALLVPLTRRAIITRAPLPIALATLSAASTAYYVQHILEHRR